MLATTFQAILDQREARNRERAEASAARDAFIAEQFPRLLTGFGTSLVAVTGQHARLALNVIATPVTYTDRGFASLDQARYELKSTLYDRDETIRFIPELESVHSNQFGVIRVETEGLGAVLTVAAADDIHESLLEHGILMRGDTAAELAVKIGETTASLTDEDIEAFLTVLLVRSS